MNMQLRHLLAYSLYFFAIVSVLVGPHPGGASTSEPVDVDTPCIKDRVADAMPRLVGQERLDEVRQEAGDPSYDGRPQQEVVGDLDGDGDEDYAVTFHLACGAHNCQWALYVSNSGCERFVGEAEGTEVFAMESTHEGLRDINSGVRMGCAGATRYEQLQSSIDFASRDTMVMELNTHNAPYGLTSARLIMAPNGRHAVIFDSEAGADAIDGNYVATINFDTGDVFFEATDAIDFAEPEAMSLVGGDICSGRAYRSVEAAVSIDGKGHRLGKSLLDARWSEYKGDLYASASMTCTDFAMKAAKCIGSTPPDRVYATGLSIFKAGSDFRVDMGVTIERASSIKFSHWITFFGPIQGYLKVDVKTYQNDGC